MPEITTIKESLHWSYANLAMAHAAITDNSTRYSQKHFIIRNKLFHGLNNKTMQLGSFTDDERVKMIMPQACNYCGDKNNLSIDHLIPKSKGGLDKPENIVWACKSCNSSKGNTDLMVWYQGKNIFPPLLLLRRYLKLSIMICDTLNVMEVKVDDSPELPFSLSHIPHRFPKPAELVLWIQPL